MQQVTYRKLSEFILNAHFAGMPTPQTGITQRQIAEKIAMKVAFFAVKDAFTNSNQGETTYTNDQFISVFKNQPLLTDADTGDKYIVLPATPAGLPHNQEISQVSFSGSPNVHVIPMKNKDDFAQSYLPKLPSRFVLYKVEDGKIIFRELPAIINSPVNVKLVGAVPGETLLDSVLNVPKDVEDSIVNSILQELSIDYNIHQQNLQIGEPS